VQCEQHCSSCSGVVVSCCDIGAVVAAWSSVPVERMSEDEMTKLMRLVSVVAVV
jgi:ATP-dependent Clp protease ATP-binding subunit ClpA